MRVFLLSLVLFFLLVSPVLAIEFFFPFGTTTAPTYAVYNRNIAKFYDGGGTFPFDQANWSTESGTQIGGTSSMYWKSDDITIQYGHTYIIFWMLSGSTSPDYVEYWPRSGNQ